MLGDGEDKLRLSPEALSKEELAVPLRLLVGDDQEYPPNAHVPLFLRKDGAQVVSAMPTFDGRGLLPPAPPAAPVAMATATVDVSSGDSRVDGEEEEGEGRDPEVTPDWMGETSPLRKADILRLLPDDDDEADVLLEREELPVVPTKGRSALLSRDDAPASTPPGVASCPSLSLLLLLEPARLRLSTRGSPASSLRSGGTMSRWTSKCSCPTFIVQPG